MLYIKKQNPDRRISTNIADVKRTRNWDALDKNDAPRVRSCFNDLNKEVIKEQLLKEQHGLCAYCMSRIRNDSNMRIDHFIPIQASGADALNYGNMVGCCNGGSLAEPKPGERKILCCDAAKGDRLLVLNPYDRTQMAKLRYRRDGRIYIYPKNETLEHDINFVLCLNGLVDEKDGKCVADTVTNLVWNRRQAYLAYERFIHKFLRRGDGSLGARVRKKIAELEGAVDYVPYAGVLLFFLKRKLREL